VAINRLKPSLTQWLPECTGKRVLVIGDLCLDEYLVGKAQRLSREAPVPVLELQERFTIPGAACNPALNIQHLGGRAYVAGAVGDDEAGRDLRTLLAEEEIVTDGLVVDHSRVTTLKTRVLANHLFPQQVVRIDRQDRSPLSRRVLAGLRAYLKAAVAQVDGVLVSDYRSGVVSAELMRVLVTLAAERRIPVAVDSQGDFQKFRGVHLLRCNREEAEGFLRTRLTDDGSFELALKALQRRLSVDAVAITRGGDGISLIDHRGAIEHLDVLNPSEVYDVTGAGDTVIAVLALMTIAGAPLAEAARLANVAAGLVVQKLGNATVTQAELVAAVQRAGLA